MTGPAVALMVLSLVIIWGGLVVSIVA
ncbi:MAG: methionine/alanine import family NSS transporter small subunit, partial [Pseudonocardia sp.]